MKMCAAFLNYRRHDLAASMIQQLDGADYPIFAFDNGGGLILNTPGVTLISRPDNVYFTAGWVWAMEHMAEFDFVWMLNDDVVEVRPDTLNVIVDAFPMGGAVVTPSFNSPHGIFHRQGTGLRSVRWIDWACPVVRMEAWRKIGPLDCAFAGYGADLDWCRRGRDTGWEFYVNDDVEIHHLGSVTALSQNLQGIQGSVAEMNRVLLKKWGVTDWIQMT